MTSKQFLSLIRKDHKFKFERAKLIDAVLGVNNSSCSIFYESMTKGEIEEQFNHVLENHTEKVITVCKGWATYKDIQVLDLESKNVNVYENKDGNLCIEFDSNINIDNGVINNPQGVMRSFMELFCNENGTPTEIEWEVPKIEAVESIGLEFDGKTLTGYDGVFDIPKEAIFLVVKAGYKFDENLIF